MTTPLFRRVLTLGRPEAGRLLLAVLLGTVAAAGTVGLLATSGWLISAAALRPPILTLQVAIAGVQAFGLSRAVARYGERLASHDAALRVLARLRVAVYRGLARVAPTGLLWQHGGDLLTRLVDDVDATQDAFLRVALPVSVSALTCVSTVVFLGALLPAAALVLLCGLAVTAVAAPLIARRAGERAGRATAPARAALATGVVDLLEGLPELVMYEAVDDRLARIAECDRELIRLERGTARAAGLSAAVATAGAGLTVAAMALVGADAVATGRLAGTLMAVLVLTPLALFDVTAALPDAARAATRVTAAAGRVFEVVDAPASVPEPAVPAAAPAWTAASRLELRGVTAVWPGRTEPALRDAGLLLCAGECVIVTGPSGAGKSTLAALLPRLLDPVAGAVTIDGVDLRELRPEDVRRIVGWSAQEAHLFDTSIRENLLVARPDATDADLWRVLHAARLDAWAHALPSGLGARVGVLGGAVSGGERQRLALARLLLADTPVIVLDEPTAHLDGATAAALAADLRAATRDRAVLWITHRPDLVPWPDAVITVADGTLTRDRPALRAGSSCPAGPPPAA